MLRKLALYAVLGVVGYGLVTGQFKPGIHPQEPAAAERVASSARQGQAGIPANYLALYQANAGKCAGLDWALLAAIGYTESNHGQSKLPGVRSGANKAGAKGPMQFKDGTWKEVRGDHPELGADVYNPANAIPAAAFYVCKYAAKRGLDSALGQYGEGPPYVKKVKAVAAEYRHAKIS